VDGAVQGEGGAHGHFDSTLFRTGRVRASEADGTDVGVRWIAETCGTAAENLGAREKLDVDSSDDGLVLREHFGREGRFSGVDFAIWNEDYSISGSSDRFAKRGEEAFGKSEAGEEAGRHTGRRRPECSRKRGFGNVAGEEASGGVWIAAEELPDGEIGDEEELDGARSVARLMRTTVRPSRSHRRCDMMRKLA